MDTAAQWNAQSTDADKNSAALLDARAVQAGDVLLSGSGSLMSRGIAIATQGVFSHASVWLPIIGADNRVRSALAVLEEHYTPLVLGEADGVGVGFTPLTPTGLIHRTTYDMAMAYVLDGDARHYKLLRHPEIGSVSSQELAAATARLQERHFIRPYSKLSRLVDTLAVGDALKRALKRSADLIMKADPESGAFCSELVALFYEELKLPLFDDERDPASIAPAHLDAAGCRLAEVPNAFLGPDRREGWVLNRPVAPILDRQTYLNSAIQGRRGADAMNAVADDMERITEELLAGLAPGDPEDALQTTANYFLALDNDEVSDEAVQEMLSRELRQRFFARQVQL